jgi:TP901 family phage tail tape measure protein
MALNEFGAGFKIYAKDFASGIFGRVGKNFSTMSNKAESDAKRLQTGMQRIGKGMALVATGLGITKPIRVAMAESRKLNKALAEVATLTDQATFPVARMKELVKGLAAEYGQDATLQAKALYQTISAGYGEAAQAARMMTTANKLAVGGVTEVETAIDGLTNVMNTYSAANLEAADVSDAMFVAMKEGKTTIGELSSQVGRVAPGAEALGIKFDELFAAISAVTSKGINTAQTASGLAAAMANLQKPTSDAVKESKRLGIEFSAAAMRSKGLKGFIDSITQSAKFNDDSISKLFGSIEAFKVMTALTANESEKFNDVLGKMAERAGATDKAVAKMTDTYEHQSKQLEQVTKNIMTTMGDAAEALMAPVLKVINFVSTGISKFLDSLPPGARKAIVAIVGSFGGFVAVAGVIVAVTGALGMLGVSISSIIVLFAKMLLFAAPLTLLFAGLSVAGYAAYRAFQKNTGGIAFSWADMVKKVKLAWKGMMAIVKGEEFGKELQKQFDRAENQGVVKFLKGFENFVEKVKVFWGGLVKGFETGVDRLAESSAMKKLQGAIDGVVRMFTGEGKDTDPEMLRKWEKQGESTGERLAKMGEIALNAIAGLVEFGKWFAEVMGQVTAEDIKASIDGAIVSFEKLWGVLKSTGDALAIIYKLVSTVVNAIQTVGAFLGDVFGRAAAEVSLSSDVVEQLFTGTSKGFKQAIDMRREFLEGNKAFAATRKQLGDFSGIWATAPQQARPAGPSARRGGVVWDRPVDTIQGLREARERTLEWMRTSTKEWRERHPGRYSFQEASADEQGRWRAEVERLELLIKKMSERPIQVVVDQEKLAESVQSSDTATGIRDLDEAGAMGF